MPWVSRPPSPETQIEVDNFNTFRGGFLSSFAQIEFTIGRLLARFNGTPPFDGALDTVKFRFESRVDAFEKFFSTRVELVDYKDEAEFLCSKLRTTYDLRNFLAHGIARFDVDTGIFTIRRILPAADNPWQEVHIEIRSEAVHSYLSDMSLFCQRFMYFAREINDKYQLQFEPV